MPTMNRCRSDAPSYARLNVFNRGVVWGMDLANASREEIQKAVTKKDGACPCIRALDSVIANMKQHPDVARSGQFQWRSLSQAQVKEVGHLAFEERGSAKVTSQLGWANVAMLSKRVRRAWAFAQVRRARAERIATPFPPRYFVPSRSQPVPRLPFHCPSTDPPLTLH